VGTALYKFDLDLGVWLLSRVEARFIEMDLGGYEGFAQFWPPTVDRRGSLAAFLTTRTLTRGAIDRRRGSRGIVASVWQLEDRTISKTIGSLRKLGRRGQKSIDFSSGLRGRLPLSHTTTRLLAR
jgi:hypothetical protein